MAIVSYIDNTESFPNQTNAPAVVPLDYNGPLFFNTLIDNFNSIHY